MKTWLITDTHFGHRKMEEWCGRPEKFEALIFKNLGVIMPGDALIHLGDFCIGEDAKWHEAWFTALPEVKRILIKGNHDSKSDSWYYDHGWHVVAEELKNTVCGVNVLFSHIPPPDRDDFDLNIHGHWHNADHHRIEQEYAVNNPRFRLLAIENTKYQPVLLETFIQKSK